ncbi:MAG: exodeoxyribonuclease VII small subunit [Phycisphaerales bacterium]|jgi:exodeoxyribonuclease VII small subunit|nr:exodeoxyribonuclease VII small subunit [Phycisphaerales bacterium]
MPDDAPDPAAMKFDEAISELETIIRKIDGGDVGLEEAMVAHRRGRALVARCRSVLDAVSEELENASDDAAAGGDAG